MAGQPVYILSEDSQRTQGRDAQASNIAAGKAVAESVRTTLGPNGMDKMLVSGTGDVVITNDGATILQEMDIEHPAAQMLVEVAESQEEEVGDGTTTAAALAGDLLARAEDLLEQDVHPTTVVEGYYEARDVAKSTVDDLTLEGKLDDEQLAQVVTTSMTGKGTGGVTAEALAEAIVRAARQVETDGRIDRDAIQIVTQPGRSSAATELVEGVVVEEEPAHDAMPRSVEDASVAVLDVALEQPDAASDVEYSISSTEQLTEAFEAEDRRFAELADALVDAGVDAAFVTEDVSDRVAELLAREGVLVFSDVGDGDARSVARAVGARRVGSLEDLEPDDLGHAETIRTETYEDDLVFVEGGAAAKTVTLFVRGGTGHVIDELERAVEDGVDVVTAAVHSGAIVPGAGAVEIAIAGALRDHAAGIESRRQLAIEAFADAIETVPRTLASNAGLDPIDALVDLRAANESGVAGLIDVGERARVDDPVEAGVLDPADVKKEALESATESATMIVRIDDVISAS